MLHLILLVFAFVLATLAAFSPWRSTPYWPPHLGWLSVAVYFLALIFAGGATLVH